MSVGDGLDYVPDGVSPFPLNWQRTTAKIKFLNFEQNLHYLFDLRGVKRVEIDLFIEENLYAKSIGDLFTYELTEVNKDILQLGFLFASGASITVQFRKLVFRRNRVKRKYEIGDMYG